MKNKKQKGLLFLIGLQLAVIGCISALLFYGISCVETSNEEMVGAILELHPEDEKNIVEIFEKENHDSIKEKWHDSGRQLLEKYGKSGLPKQEKQMLTILLVMGGALLSMQTLLLLFWYRNQKNNRLKLMQEIERSRENYQELGVRYEQMSQRLRQEEQSTKGLVTDISHQLKTPIASLKMSHELAESIELTKSERLEFRQKEMEELKKLESLLDTLMNLSKLEAKMIQICPVKARIDDTIRRATSSVYIRAMKKNIDISAEHIPAVEILHDPKWTEEVLVNIIDNAVKYSPENTHIQIRGECLVSFLVIEVEDEGIGISSTERNKIFQRFYRGEKAMEMSKEGAGVGLYLARRIIEEQKGTLSVKDAIGGGSIFRIMLPL